MKKEISTVSEKKFINKNTISDQESDLIAKFIMLRTESKMSQKKIAELTGMAQSTIARIETNVINANIVTFIKMVDALGYHLEIVKNK